MKYFLIAWRLMTRARPILKQMQELYDKSVAVYADKKITKDEVREVVAELIDVLAELGLAPHRLR